MLVLTRRIGEEIVLPGSEVTIAVLSVAGSKVKLGVTAPASVPVHRKEVLKRAGHTAARTGERPAVGGSSPAPAGRDRGSAGGPATPTATQDVETQLISAITKGTGGNMKSLRVRIFGDRIAVEGYADSYDTVRLANLALLEALNQIDADWPEKIDMEVEIVPPEFSSGPVSRPDRHRGTLGSGRPNAKVPRRSPSNDPRQRFLR